MTEIRLRFSDNEKAESLLSYLSSLDFVEILHHPEEEKPQKEALAEVFYAMQSFHVFQDISDPTAWQKEQRNEWE